MSRSRQKRACPHVRRIGPGIDTIEEESISSKRTGKSKFDLPEDFDEHFDDLNDEIASMFYGENYERNY